MNFASTLNNEGFTEKAPSFDSWVLLSGGVVETVFYKEVASKHVHNKCFYEVVDAVNYEQTHVPMIGKIHTCKFFDFNTMCNECVSATLKTY